MHEKNLIKFRRISGYQALIDDLSKGQRKTLISLPRSVRLPFLAAIQKHLAKTVLFITSKSDRLQAMVEEFKFWGNGAEHYAFSEPSPLFYEDFPWSPGVRFDRLDVLSSLINAYVPGRMHYANPIIIFASVKSLMTKTAPRREFIRHSLTIEKNKSYAINNLARRLVEANFQPTEIVTRGGQFSRRGGIMDVWPATDEQPVRIEFFGDEIDTMRFFDPASQRSTGSAESVFITPAKEAFSPRKEIDKIQEDIHEFSIPMVFTSSGSLLDYLPKESIVIFDNASSLQATADEVELQSVRIRNENEELGVIEKGFPIPYFTWSEILEEISGMSQLDLGFPLGEMGHEISEAFSPAPRFGSRLDDMFNFLTNDSDDASRIYIVSKQVNRIQEVQKDIKLDDSLTGRIIYFEGSLNAGWRTCYDDGHREYLFTDSELFGWELPQPRRRERRISVSPEMYFADFMVGDLVVHADHGIARFCGLVSRTIEGVDHDYLLLRFAGDDELFVPIHQVDRINTYIGPDNRKPKLSKLGSDTWKANRSQAKRAVKSIAFDLLELYALRQTVSGHAFQKDGNWQTELEASFPFKETLDQMRAIKEVKADMEAPKPMDRLLCGDVGYGKTEVALRSAFKAVLDDKQVAMLVPTTVLAKQHFETFQSRLTPFPVNVEMLSRFRTSAEQMEILRKLENKAIDVVIGTHRLLQSDVRFHDLGLLIIDEEQRFGVTHKEFFKKMRREIDVLTLTATPIPRTLYMALSGIRDISVINSPPAERLPIMTFTGPYDEKIVRKAVIREIDRGGQVFFVHNRVQTIRTVAAQLTKLVPEARIGVGHGQMREKDLEAVMEKFTAGEIDVLLSTSIIESGLDIPNANTLILDRADTFGLAQLYQLRGRVGRGSSRAYAYFFHHQKRLPTAAGLERLEIIAENTHLGAGYSIAMRDLEMRGAGDLLGAMQSGYIASVGFHLYTRLLSEAVQEIKVEKGFRERVEKILTVKPIRPLVKVELPLPVLLPAEYIPDDSLRLQLYRRIAEMEIEKEINQIIEEFSDRFGVIPPQVINLLYQMRVKLKAERCGVPSITNDGNSIKIKFPSVEEYGSILPMGIPGQVRKGKFAYWIPIDKRNIWRERLISLLDSLIEKRIKHEL